MSEFTLWSFKLFIIIQKQQNSALFNNNKNNSVGKQVYKYMFGMHVNDSHFWFFLYNNDR